MNVAIHYGEKPKKARQNYCRAFLLVGKLS